MLARPEIFVSTDDLPRLFDLAGKAPDYWNVAQGLFEELERATVLKPWAMPDNIATMHSLICFQNEETGRVQVAKLVYPHEVDGSPGRLSVLEPAGAALLGLSAGDRIAWPVAGGGFLHYQLIQVLYQSLCYS